MGNVLATPEQQKVYLPVSVLYGWLLRFLGIFVLIVVWAGYFFLKGTWPAPFKLWLCTALGVAAVLRRACPKNGIGVVSVARFSQREFL